LVREELAQRRPAGTIVEPLKDRAHVSGLRNDDRRCAAVLRNEVDLERGERTRRRSGDVASRQIVRAAVAVAPDPIALLLKSDDAVEVRARGGERTEVILRGADDDHRIGAEANDLEALL